MKLHWGKRVNCPWADFILPSVRSPTWQAALPAQLDWPRKGWIITVWWSKTESDPTSGAVCALCLLSVHRRADRVYDSLIKIFSVLSSILQGWSCSRWALCRCFYDTSHFTALRCKQRRAEKRSGNGLQLLSLAAGKDVGVSGRQSWNTEAHFVQHLRFHHIKLRPSTHPVERMWCSRVEKVQQQQRFFFHI